MISTTSASASLRYVYPDIGHVDAVLTLILDRWWPCCRCCAARWWVCLVQASRTQDRGGGQYKSRLYLCLSLTECICLQAKAAAWTVQNWMQEAQVRTEAFHRNGPQGPATWVLVHGKEIPQGALQAGEENGNVFFACRTFHEVSILCCGDRMYTYHVFLTGRYP